MPVSHLGLTVSHIPASTSFYLATLQPLGYRYLGTQGNSIGLGVTDADFFLCQEPNGQRTTPTHVAFAADDRITVRNCYAAALNAGASPSGAPSYRNNDSTCFNAAIVDLDGNTIEFIYREMSPANGIPAPSETRRSSTSQSTARQTSVKDDAESSVSKSSRRPSKCQTISDLASATSKSMRTKSGPSPGVTRSRTEPIGSKGDSKALMGTILGAAAGAALAFAAVSSERDGARQEAAYAASLRSKDSASKRTSSSKAQNRIVEGTESKSSRQYPPRSLARAIEAPPSRPDADDEDVWDAVSRHTSSRRPAPSRSRTYDDAMGYDNGASETFTMRRARTLPVDAPRSATSSRRSSRRGSIDSAQLKRRDSGVGIPSARRSRRQSDAGRYSSASTIKPLRQSGLVYESAADVPLPASRTSSYYTTTPAPAPPTPSRLSSYVSATSKPAAPVYRDGEESDGLGDMQTVVPEDSISCVDFSKTRRTSQSDRHSVTRRSPSNAFEVAASKPAKKGRSRGDRSSHERSVAATLPLRSRRAPSEGYGRRSQV